ncbi:hypothetical protein [Psychrobacter sp. FDAARGOS_221]|uniref:hypothetical protein n=1 Tax=Psychrobacter sp. FDAARGOS_221 TaxID=1975705 RepID=UPI000BB55AA3|nr:hypothetical protein [Psychrobacter sp. FDAARGOS_221]PNK60946.1 hypothetical protein A6J60_008685 [Psychrobacter sp. FDAARGOS_221]
MQKLIGIVFAFIGLALTMALFNSGNNTPVAQWPSEGFQNLVFSIGWLSPFPDFVVYLIAILLLLLVAVVFYKIGSKLYGAISR